MSDQRDATEQRRTIATGETVTVPLRTEATIAGAAFTASLDAVRDLTPPSLSPVRVSLRRSAVLFVSVDYREVSDGAVEPYDEFGVIVPVTHESGPLPWSGLGGWVWYLPVTTEPARALGELWGYPKVVADISIEDEDGRRRTTLEVDGERVATLEVAHARTFGASVSARSYTRKEGTLLAEPTTLSGQLGGWPCSGRASIEFGDHPRGRRLAGLDVGNRALVRLFARGSFRIGHPEPVED